MGDWFYSLYAEFLDRAKAGVIALKQAIRDCSISEENRRRVDELTGLLLPHRAAFGSAAASLFSGLAENGFNAASAFSDAAKDVDLLKFDRLAFLLAATAVHFIRETEPR